MSDSQQLHDVIKELKTANELAEKILKEVVETVRRNRREQEEQQDRQT